MHLIFQDINYFISTKQSEFYSFMLFLLVIVFIALICDLVDKEKNKWKEKNGKEKNTIPRFIWYVY